MGERCARFVHRDEFVSVAAGFTDQQLLQLLGVTRATLNAWRRGQRRVAWAPYELVRQNSYVGLAERDAKEQFNRSMLQGQLEAMKRRIEYLENELRSQAAQVAWECANDPYIHPQDPRSQASPKP